MPFRCGWGLRLMESPIGYIAYIDEAGDDGIKKIRSETENGSSEWLVISAVVIHAENEPRLIPWLKDTIARQRRGHQMHSFANRDRAGLQLADTVASAFYCGLEELTTAPPNSEYAKLLEPRMAFDDQRRILDCGVKIMPKWVLNRLTGPAKDLVAYYAKR
jgi:hypothetical protein